MRLAESRAPACSARPASPFTTCISNSAGAEMQRPKDTSARTFPDTPWRLETPDDRRENLGDALDNFQQFLGIIALVALVLGAIGVAGAVHAHVSRRVPTVAILRCLGCPGDLAFGIYFAQAIALGVLGAVLGAGIGIALHTGVLTFFRESLPIAVDPAPEWGRARRPPPPGFAVCCGFALLPLLRVRRISPAATLRDGAALEGGERCARAAGLSAARRAARRRRAAQCVRLEARARHGRRARRRVRRARRQSRADWSSRRAASSGPRGRICCGRASRISTARTIRRCFSCSRSGSAPSCSSPFCSPAISSRSGSRSRSLPRARTSISSMCSPIRSRACSALIVD